ncbi:MAG TPA: LamG-like jellyroll fold domain-containing protein, partial [Candidatus Paceibacterota bacterium]|nr:LamG-like jellyroll fold domain-containing protein [Candidatus Paceibacterota bacterium]
SGAAAFNGAGSVTLNGTSGTYVNLGGGLLNGLTSATFAGWFSYDQSVNNVHLFSFDDGIGHGSENGGAWNGSYLRYNLYDTGNGNNGVSFVEIPNKGNPNGGKLSGTGVLAPNTPTYVAFTYDVANGVQSLYVNGALQSSSSGALAALNTIFNTRGTLGVSPWDAWGDPYLKGSIDQFSIYDGALSGAPIATDFAAGPAPVPEPSSVALGLTGLGLISYLRRRNGR